MNVLTTPITRAKLVASYSQVKVYRCHAASDGENVEEPWADYRQLIGDRLLALTDYAQRLREFRKLFATCVRESTRLHLTLDASLAREEDVGDLLRREEECSFFFYRRCVRGRRALRCGGSA
jgi:hypothetical protein